MHKNKPALVWNGSRITELFHQSHSGVQYKGVSQKKQGIFCISLHGNTTLQPTVTFEYESVKVLVRFEYGLVKSYSDTALRLEVNRPKWCTTKRR